MNNGEWNEVLAAVLEDALDKMFFVGEVLETSERRPEPAAAVRVSFEGHPSGSMGLRLTASAARTIAGDFLGEDGDALSDRQVEEVVCELANMICGSVLSRVDRAGEIRINEPHLSPTGDLEVAGSPRAFEVGGGTLEIVFESV